MIQTAGGVPQASSYVLSLEVWVGLQDRLRRLAAGQQIKHVRNSNPHSANTRAATALIGIEGDSFEIGHGFPLLGLNRQNSRLLVAVQGSWPLRKKARQSPAGLHSSPRAGPGAGVARPRT